MDLKKNSIIELEITDINNLGYGVGKHGGITVFVAGAVDGDNCRVKIIKVARTWCVGKIEDIKKSSPERISPECEHFARCGGCAYQSIGYEHEKELKRNYVRAAFRKAGLADVKINETVSDGVICGYRNKAQYPVSVEGGRYTVGFYSSKSHRVTDGTACSLQPRIFGEVCEKLKVFFEQHKLSVYDEQTGRGLLRHIYLRAAAKRADLMLCLVINGKSTGVDAELCAYVKKHIPAVTTLLLNENTEATNVVLGKRYFVLFGEGHIKDELCGVELEIAPSAFYQVNHGMAEKLYAKAAELARPEEADAVYDIYCGTGSIGLSMSTQAKRIVGVDVEPSAIECAKKNARACGAENAEFFCADATGSSGLFESVGIENSLEDSVVIFDPPRKGSSESFIEYITQKNPKRVVYISCNPDTLARDSVYFRANGYINREVTPYDLFPRTGHVECVTLFEKAI